MKKKNIICLISILISVLLLFLNEHYFKDLDDLLYNMLLTVSITLLTTSVFSVISNFFTNDVDTIASLNFSVLKSCQTYGLIGIYPTIPLNDNTIKEDFVNSKKVYIIMNDAKAFISDNMNLFNDRIKKNNSTTFVLQNYEQNDIMSALTRKNGHSDNPNYYIDKIKNVITYHIKTLNLKNPKHKIKLYLNSNYNTTAIILTDHYAILSIYRYAPEKSSVPHFVFHCNGSEYSIIKNDINTLIGISQEYNKSNSQ